MTKILFVCQGNTCRSPLAEAIAKRIFGANHSVASAGLETAPGLSAAPHARTVAKELRLDLSSHKTRSLESFNLNDFDLLVSMDGVVATRITPSEGVRFERWEVADPYGKPVGDYRKTGVRIQRHVRQLYAADALYRLTSTAPPKGSHVLGVVVRAAKEFEKETLPLVKVWCPTVKDRTPLGSLAKSLRREALKSSAKNAKAVVGLADVMTQVNKSWVRLKHQDDPPLPELVAATTVILRGFQLLDVCAAV